MLFVFVGALLFPFLNYKYFDHFAEPYLYTDCKKVPKSYTALVLGAKVLNDKRVSYVLHDRIVSGLELYQESRVQRFLLSGDHGSKEYDEVNTMKYHLLKNGVDSGDVFLDHAGFDTFDSVVRAKKIFGVNEVIIVSQRFHLIRALYIARKNGLNAYGYVADKRVYPHMKQYKKRELLARVKALFDVTFKSKPKYLGTAIAIDGDSRKSWD